MSVSFTVHRADGRETTLPYAPQGTAVNVLAPLGRELGLQLVPLLPSWYPIEAANVRQAAGELRVLLEHVRMRYPTSVILAESIERIIVELDQLANEVGWRADFG